MAQRKSKKLSTTKNARKQRLAPSEKVKDITIHRELAPTARKINAHLLSAEKSDDKAVDHRLAAAIELKSARETCDKAGVNFKQWAEKNVTQGYETVRKLVVVGKSKEPKLALEDMRAKNAAANKRLRAKTRTTAASRRGAAATSTSAPKDKPVPAGQAALAGLDRMKKGEKKNLITSQAAALGMQVVEDGLAVVQPGTTMIIMAQVQDGFSSFTMEEQRSFLTWASELIGATVTFSDRPGNGVDEMPAGLKRRSLGGKRRRAANRGGAQ